MGGGRHHERAKIHHAWSGLYIVIMRGDVTKEECQNTAPKRTERIALLKAENHE